MSSKGGAGGRGTGALGGPCGLYGPGGPFALGIDPKDEELSAKSVGFDGKVGGMEVET